MYIKYNNKILYYIILYLHMLSKLSQYTIFASGLYTIYNPSMKKYSLGLISCVLMNDIFDNLYSWYEIKYPQNTIAKDIIVLSKTAYYLFSYKTIANSLLIMGNDNKWGFVFSGLKNIFGTIESIFRWSFTVNMVCTSLFLISFPILKRIANRFIIDIANRIGEVSDRLENVNIEYNGIKIYSSFVLSSEQIEKISPHRCAGLKNINQDNTEFSHPENCSICLDKYDEKQLTRILPCKHSFHVFCIDEWLKKSNSFCPICRDDLKKYLDTK
jgi:hypothetical protein